MYSSFVQKLIDEGILKEALSIKDGTIVLYRNSIEYSGEISHAAILKNKTTAISKWSWGPIIGHALLTVPFSYGSELTYYEPLNPEVVLVAYKKFKTYNRP